ncbi:MAG: hypothetical protein AAGC60_28250 [Acidobacteriota bacterium]
MSADSPSADRPSADSSSVQRAWTKTAVLDSIGSDQRRRVRRLDHASLLVLAVAVAATLGLLGLQLSRAVDPRPAALLVVLWALAPYAGFALSMRFERNATDALIVFLLATCASGWGLWALADALLLAPAPFLGGATLLVVPFVQLVVACFCFVFAWIRSYRRRC